MRPSDPRRLRGILIGIIVILLLSINTIVRLYTDLLWYREVGFASVFFKLLGAKFQVAGVFGLVFLTLLLVNLYVVSRIRPEHAGARDPRDPMLRFRTLFAPYMRRAAIGGSLLLTLLVAGGITAESRRFLLFNNAVEFGQKDPQFGRDIGFYFFKLPMYELAYGWGLSALVVILLAVAGAHYVMGGIRPQAQGDWITPAARAHLSVILGLIAFTKAAGYRLDQFGLVFSTRGEITGATYTDVNAELPALTLMIAIAIIAGILLLINIRFRGWGAPLVALGLWFVVGVIATGIYPFLVQRFRVEPAQLQRERPFIQRNITATRAAFALDKVEVTEYSPATGITPEVVQANASTAENIRLFSPDILKEAYKQLQEIRHYYEFQDVDVDRYRINGDLRQVMLSTRELTLGNIPTKNWQNDHLVYTHGYGAVVSPTNETTSDGTPSFLLRDIPPVSAAPEVKLDRGGIYFGESLGDYSIVKTEQRELDYPRGTAGNQMTTYNGKGGIEVGGFMRRLAFAWRFRSLNILISGLIDEDSRVIFNRDIRSRASLSAPFLNFDGDPYPVIAGGKLTWVLDGYSVSDAYPYSQLQDFSSRTGNTRLGRPTIDGFYNYVRNSVKTTIDAYDGTITFYVWDDKEPVVAAWRKVFPELFKPASQMPAELRAHVRYPEDIFRVQTDVYRRYHMTDPQEWFTNEDLWVIPRNPGQGRAAAATAETQANEIQPYYVLMKRPGEEAAAAQAPGSAEQQEQYMLILPMNPRGRPNMVAWFAANSGPESFGEMTDFRFPKTRQIFGVGQIFARINQDDEISRQRTLLGQRGSRIRFGNLLVIPIGESIIYVQPLFLESDENPIPQLELVVVATSERLGRGRTLEEAFNNLLQGGTVSIGTDIEGASGEEATPTELVAEALRHLEAADEAARRGDWARYGEEQRRAREALRRAQGESPGPSPTPSPASGG